MPPKKKGGKKDDDWDDVETTATKKMAALKVEESAFDDESDEEPAKPQPKAKGRPGMSAFLMMEDDDEEKSEKSEAEDAPVESKPAAKADTAKDKKAKNKGKKGKKQTAEDDELDALLENLNKPGEAPAGKKKEKLVGEAQVVEEGEVKEAEATPDKEVEDKKKSKKKKKDKEKTAEEQPATADAEKKEDQDEDGEAKEGDEEAGDDKKKKKKKGKKEEKPKKNKQAEAIKEMLRRKEEAELEAKRLAQEEEERILAAEKKREEEERIEKERRDAEKLRKKQKEEQLKKEGKWLTPAQRAKQQQQRARLGAQFDKIKEEAPTKKVVYEDLSKKKQQQQKERDAQLAEAVSTSKEPEKEDSPVEEKVEKEEVAEEKQEEPLDDWELADVDDTKKETEAKAKETTQTNKVAVPVKEQQQEESSESEEGSSEEESDESEEDESESEEESSSEDEGVKKETKEMKMERIRLRLKQRREKAIAEKSVDNLRAPIICVLGHVDTGKTKMLDTIRRTNVQDGEAGGITQQIGATQVPRDAIVERCKQVREFRAADVKVPGFLIIDTPGHESFANLRSRGSSLCDFAILVVDLMHGLEQQTLESIKLLVKRHTPFVVALNKIDRLHMYESSPRKDVYVHLGTQANNVKLEFKKRYEEVVVQFAEQGLNVCLSNDKKKMADPDYIPMVPTSAYCGDGIGNLMAFIAEMAQSKYSDRLAFIEELDATVMEVKAIPGLGTTIDVILVNGRLKNNDIIVLSGIDGPIVSQIRDLKMPEPLRELRVKSEYRSFKEIQGAQGVKVLAKGMEKALAGLPLYVVNQADEIDLLQAECEAALSKALTSIKKKPEGVYVQASTLGSLEALLEFLKTQKIPYANVNIGPAQLAADREGVRIFQADIIYHLEDDFLKYREELRQKYRREHEHLAVFPCKLRVLPQHVFNARNPIVCGVSIEAGQLKKGAPICVPSKESIFLGNVASIERNHEEVGLAKAGEEVCIKIENTTGEAPKLYGRHFTHEDFLVTRLTRESIDACKAYFRDDLSKADWQLVIELKKTLDIL
ncbi:unnamed protein product, partial [Mesorhabditis belari]|uniref:Eukaryotic translation initiation factor 5B n=1 Tax=Mesorhabditis belari TaxID=2138241 RepID=A0AAF3EA66_9BILA